MDDPGFSGFYTENYPDAVEISKSPVAFLTFYPIFSAVKHRLAHKVGHVPLDAESQEIPIFRYGIPDPRTRKIPVWCFWDGEKGWAVENITEEQRKLPMEWVVNYQSLKEMIEDEWRPEKSLW
ncbi:hypothetical protein [Komagataeibacter xylinus]|uniref:hypothetical protein n=1 Tax=Komagataeibacter xylinus TaxID=28448 RepID=UPI00280BE4C4|nr:hypothetical protein [Komagataeibacter xylinus]